MRGVSPTLASQHLSVAEAVNRGCLPLHYNPR